MLSMRFPQVVFHVWVHHHLDSLYQLAENLCPAIRVARRIFLSYADGERRIVRE